MRDQFRIERYEAKMYNIRYLSVGIILYSVALIAYVHTLLKDNVWLMLLGLGATLLVFRMLAGFFGGIFSKKSKRGREVIFLPLAVIIFACYAIAGARNYTETSWVEMIALVLFLGMGVYALYLAHYVRFVNSNKDADYMAIYHVTLGNFRAYRLWYLVTILVVVAIAVMPFWNGINSLWKGILAGFSKRWSQGGSSAPQDSNPTGETAELTPAPDEGGAVFDNIFGDALSETAQKVILVLIALFVLFCAFQAFRILLVKITDAKTSMATDHIIDLKKTAVIPPVPDEVIRLRNDDVFDENSYARRIRRTFKRAVFDRYGNDDVPEKTPQELLGRKSDDNEILLEKYEKARYSNIPCTAEDVKAVKAPKQS